MRPHEPNPFQSPHARSHCPLHPLTVRRPYRTGNEDYTVHNYQCDHGAGSPFGGHTTHDTADWFYFSGAAGYRMPVSPPAHDDACGTNFQGWLSTGHPELGAPAEVGQVCFKWQSATNSNSCIQDVDVKVCLW